MKNKPKYGCGICGKGFSTEDHLREHVEADHQTGWSEYSNLFLSSGSPTNSTIKFGTLLKSIEEWIASGKRPDSLPDTLVLSRSAAEMSELMGGLVAVAAWRRMAHLVDYIDILDTRLFDPQEAKKAPKEKLLARLSEAESRMGIIQRTILQFLKAVRPAVKGQGPMVQINNNPPYLGATVKQIGSSPVLSIPDKKSRARIADAVSFIAGALADTTTQPGKDKA